MLTDDTGVIQHANRSVPNRSTGYCTDDVARAFMVALQASAYEELRHEALRMASMSLAFLLDAQREDGRFHNFMSYGRQWLDDVGSEDSCGRAVWALGYGVRFAPQAAWGALCSEMLERALGFIPSLHWSRAQSYAILGLAHALEADTREGPAVQALRSLDARLRERYAKTRRADWRWFEDEMTYDNARLCEAVLRAGAVLGDAASVDVGLEALHFLETVTFEGGHFVPIGNRGWYRRDGERARFDQQPLEAAAMVDAELAALAATGEEVRLQKAADSFSWYLGRNDLRESLVRGDGCCDGLSELSVNQNMGAESTLAYLSSAFAMAEAQDASASKKSR